MPDETPVPSAVRGVLEYAPGWAIIVKPELILVITSGLIGVPWLIYFQECSANLLSSGAGVAILLVSAELEEVRSLADRILVMADGRITGELAAADFDATRIGLMMAGAVS